MKTKLFHAAVLGLLATGLTLTAQAGGGDNDMNPMYGDSWAALEGNGRNVDADGPRSHLMDPVGSALQRMGGDARASMQQANHTVAETAEHMQAQARASIQSWQDRMAVTPPQGVVPSNPFSDATGG